MDTSPDLTALTTRTWLADVPHIEAALGKIPRSVQLESSGVLPPPFSLGLILDTMAEAIGLASGLLTLTTFAFKSSVALSDTVKSFQSHPKRVRELLDELETLSGALGSLTETTGAIDDIDFTALKLPLLRCGTACEEFKREIIKCSSRSGESQTSFRDWAKLKYLGGDIDGFRQLLSGYSLTITVAVADANL